MYRFRYVILLLTLLFHFSCSNFIGNDNDIMIERDTINQETVYVSMKLVQRRSNDRVASAQDLVGKEVAVVENSACHKRLLDLNSEIGGGIKIKTFDYENADERLILKIVQGKLDYCILYADVVERYSQFYPLLDYGYSVSIKTKKQKEIFERYKGEQKPYRRISPYDAIFKKYAASIQWDWRLLAALSWCESHFNSEAESKAGAKGLMQMMPVTAERFGITAETINNPDSNIYAGVNYIKYLNRMFLTVNDREERIKFILASYNAGPQHVLDAMRLASKYGYNKYLWENNVEKFLILKNVKFYYTDNVCKGGYFRSSHTVRFIDDVYKKYEKFVRD